jgi:hypothetical protein
MIDATLKNALAFFEEDLEAARDIFMAAVEDAASGPSDEIDDLVDDILEDAEEGPKDGFIVVEREAIEALRSTPYDVSGELNDALESFNWKFNKALRELKQALVRETAEG